VKAKKTGYWMHYEVDGDALESYGKGLAKLFGGWVRPQPGGKGTAHCPPGLLKECQTQKPGTEALKRSMTKV
jgi:hypothetical protein